MDFIFDRHVELVGQAFPEKQIAPAWPSQSGASAAPPPQSGQCSWLHDNHTGPEEKYSFEAVKHSDALIHRRIAHIPDSKTFATTRRSNIVIPEASGSSLRGGIDLAERSGSTIRGRNVLLDGSGSSLRTRHDVLDASGSTWRGGIELPDGAGLALRGRIASPDTSGSTMRARIGGPGASGRTVRDGFGMEYGRAARRRSGRVLQECPGMRHLDGMLAGGQTGCAGSGGRAECGQ